jgi:hypothetical protein
MTGCLSAGIRPSSYSLKTINKFTMAKAKKPAAKKKAAPAKKAAPKKGAAKKKPTKSGGTPPGTSGGGH